MANEQIEGYDKFQADMRRLRMVFDTKAPKFFARQLAESWVGQISEVGAIDTSAFLFSVDYRAGSGPQSDALAGFTTYVVDTEENDEVRYSSLVERGTENIDGSVRMAARWPARRGIERVPFSGIIDDFVRDSFRHAL